MSERLVYPVRVPQQHLDVNAIDANDTTILGSRGSFKSSIGIALYIIRRIIEMPRSTGAGVGLSFEHLMDNTLPPVKAFLASRGFVENLHYTIMKPPPAHWPKPYAGVLDPAYKHAWTWYNGATIQLISLRRKASANGVSAQWGFFDECKFMDPKELEDEIFPIFRPVEESADLFSHLGSYMGKFFATDKNADPAAIKWLINKRKLVDHRKAALVKSLQMHVEETMQAYAGKKIPTDIQKEIEKDKARLHQLRSKLVYVAEINADDVRPILGDKWYFDKKRNSTEHEWKVIYLNQDPDRPGETFYPNWKEEVHVYESDRDIDTNKPLIIAADYQHTVAPIPIAQLGKLPGAEKVTLNFVDEVYTLHPKGLGDAIDLFCEKNKYHQNKSVFYVHDHTAKGKRVDADDYVTIVVDRLKHHGWNVVEVYIGQAPGHYQKYQDSMEYMENKEGKYIDIRVNKKCEKLIISIAGAGAVTMGRETKKDKKGETEKALDQSETTHFSDAFDMTVNAVIKQQLIKEVVEKNPIALR